jgi:uncharacterized oligopeptide transporter (OPT) family protein
MDQKKFEPFVPASSDMAELTVKAVVLGAVMAVVLGAANAYLGMKAGLTVAATFPAAVVAMAALRPFKGTILEENVARTAASVGEALVAGAIFTIPAFVISGAWEELRYWESTAIMLIGGLLGVLFIIVLRRTLVVEADLPFPESVAAAEIVKAGQGGQTGASYVQELERRPLRAGCQPALRLFWQVDDRDPAGAGRVRGRHADRDAVGVTCPHRRGLHRRHASLVGALLGSGHGLAAPRPAGVLSQSVAFGRFER